MVDFYEIQSHYPSITSHLVYLGNDGVRRLLFFTKH